MIEERRQIRLEQKISATVVPTVCFSIFYL